LDVFEKVESQAVVADFVWIEKLSNDSFEAAQDKMPVSEDPRTRVWWDSENVLPGAVGEHMCADVAWDVYLFYDPGRVWDDDDPGAPDAFFHKLSECPSDQYMSRYDFWQELEARLPDCDEVVLDR